MEPPINVPPAILSIKDVARRPPELNIRVVARMNILTPLHKHVWRLVSQARAVALRFQSPPEPAILAAIIVVNHRLADAQEHWPQENGIQLRVPVNKLNETINQQPSQQCEGC